MKGRKERQGRKKEKSELHIRMKDKRQKDKTTDMNGKCKKIGKGLKE